MKRSLLFFCFLMVQAVAGAQNAGPSFQVSAELSRFRSDLQRNLPAYGASAKLLLPVKRDNKFSLTMRLLALRDTFDHSRPTNRRFLNLSSGYRFSLAPMYIEPQLGYARMAGEKANLIVAGFEVGITYKRFQFGVLSQYATEKNILFGESHYMNVFRLGYLVD